MTDDRRLVLYPFNYFDLVHRRWYRARYVCELEEMAVRYPAFRITGKPEVRIVGDPGAYTAGHLAQPAS
jgi:hypothetical protein